jgi:hypothetical protein
MSGYLSTRTDIVSRLDFAALRAEYPRNLLKGSWLDYHAGGRGMSDGT